jgi:hypothetical protein
LASGEAGGLAELQYGREREREPERGWKWRACTGYFTSVQYCCQSCRRLGVLRSTEYGVQHTALSGGPFALRPLPSSAARPAVWGLAPMKERRKVSCECNEYLYIYLCSRDPSKTL